MNHLCTYSDIHHRLVIFMLDVNLAQFGPPLSNIGTQICFTKSEIDKSSLVGMSGKAFLLKKTIISNLGRGTALSSLPIEFQTMHLWPVGISLLYVYTHTCMSSFVLTTLQL